MNIFLRRIPANTKHQEISDFIAPALKGSFLQKTGRIVRIEILVLQDTRAGTIEYHGLVTLDSQESVSRVVKKLKNQRLNGRLVTVRPYFHRSWYNDPRQLHPQPDPSIVERRKGDRRRGKHLEVIKNASDRFSSEDDFFETIQHQPYLLTLIIPHLIKDAVTESLLAVEFEQPHPIEAQNVKFLTEQHDNLQTATRLQMYVEKKEITVLLDTLKERFADTGIHYWVVPVSEKGII